VGVIVPVGVTEFKASYSNFITNASGKPEGQKYAIGAVYNLSKRSAIYTTLAEIRNSNGSALSISGSTTAPNHNSTGFDLGFRHFF
jgi:predicted porin